MFVDFLVTVKMDLLWLKKGQASSPQSHSGTISRIEADRVILNLGSGRVEVPLAQLQVDGRPAQRQDLRVSQVCVQEGGVWKVQPSPAPPMKPGFAPQSGTIVKIELQGVILNLGSGRVEVPLAQLQVDGRPASLRDLKLSMLCVQEGGVWQVRSQVQAAEDSKSSPVPSLLPKEEPKINVSAESQYEPKVALLRPLNPSKPSPLPTFESGTCYSVFKIEVEVVKIKGGGRLYSLPRSSFTDQSNLRVGCYVSTNDGKRWTVTEMPLATSISKVVAPNIYLIRAIKGETVFAIEVGPTIEVPVSRILTPDKKPVAAEQLDAYLRLQQLSTSSYILLDAPRSAAPLPVPQLPFKQR